MQSWFAPTQTSSESAFERSSALRTSSVLIDAAGPGGFGFDAKLNSVIPRAMDFGEWGEKASVCSVFLPTGSEMIPDF